jgi:branched-chain amino acid transport system ATP-binding protein
MTRPPKTRAEHGKSAATPKRSKGENERPAHFLELRGIEAGYGELMVLRGVDVHVQPGEIVALIGPNGAGKSTILKTVFHLTKVTAGKVFFEGEEITELKTHELLRRRISYMPQGRINFSELTVLENLQLGAEGMDQKQRDAAIKRVYERFPILKERQDEYAFSLSGGQQQMLAIGRALLQEPKLLLMDEPSLGLSPKLQQELFQIIQGLRDEGIAVLIVEQNAKKAIEIADRTYLLEQGRVVLTGGREVLQDKKIREVYLGGG